MAYPKYRRTQPVKLNDGAVGTVAEVLSSDTDGVWSYRVERLELTATTIVPETDLTDAIVSKDEARHVLYYRGKPGGMDGGGFVHALLRTIEAADAVNLAKLRSAFPGYVAAMRNWYQSDLEERLAEED